MLMAENKITNIPPEWHHNPTLRNKNGYTVAMIMAENGITNIPPEFWHDPTLRNKNKSL